MESFLGVFLVVPTGLLGTSLLTLGTSAGIIQHVLKMVIITDVPFGADLSRTVMKLSFNSRSKSVSRTDVTSLGRMPFGPGTWHGLKKCALASFIFDLYTGYIRG